MGVEFDLLGSVQRLKFKEREGWSQERQHKEGEMQSKSELSLVLLIGSELS